MKKTFTKDMLDEMDWGDSFIKDLKHEKRNHHRLVNASWFFLGVIITGITMHLLFIKPLLNSLI
jgi:hypothetical protein